jgi:hypothetical protein
MNRRPVVAFFYTSFYIQTCRPVGALLFIFYSFFYKRSASCEAPERTIAYLFVKHVASCEAKQMQRSQDTHLYLNNFRSDNGAACL